MEYSGLSFVEAVKDLAARAGVKVPETAPEARAPTPGPDAPSVERLAETLQQAAQFYKGELRKSERAIEYLKGRGLTGAIAVRFGLGFAPAGWQSLAAVLADYSSRGPVEAGLVIQGEDGKRYDRFRERIMFPIVSQRGQIIGFGGRVLDKSEPKYLNSPETPLFEKGRELYGLFQARQAIREAGRAVVVEGYMDVVALAQFGVGYAVATLGTATTPWHVQKLLRQTDEVVFSFDGDSAGRRAAWRALENSLEQLQDGKQVKFVLPGHDRTASSARTGSFRGGTGTGLAAVGCAQELSGGWTWAAQRSGQVSARRRTACEAHRRTMLGLVLRKRVAELAGITQAELEQRFEIGVRRQASPAPARGLRSGLSADPYAKLLERLLAEPRLLHEIHSDLPHPRQPAPEAAALLDLIEQARALPGELRMSRDAIELLRGRGHDGVLQRLLPMVHDLEGLSVEELAVEVRAYVETLHRSAQRAAMDRAVAELPRPAVDEQDRGL